MAMTRLPLYFRCYTEKKGKKRDKPRLKLEVNQNLVLVLDTETRSDEFQGLVFGSCGVWSFGKLRHFCIFYDDNLSKQDIEKITKIASKRKCELLSRKDFVEQVFIPNVYRVRAICVGFNLPFDLSRLATYCGKSKLQHNGFSLKLSENKSNPRIVIKSLDGKSAFIQFASPSKTETEKKSGTYRGCFVDLKTFIFSLTNESYNLKNALIDFGSPYRKLETDEHGVISKEYVDYNINDTLATHDLYLQAMKRYITYHIRKHESELYSPASIGKSYLEQIGIVPFLKQNPSFSRELLGYVMMTYLGGRTDCMIRKTPTKTSYIDFTSMYPTIYVLLQMDKFLKAKKIIHHKSTKKTQRLLDTITKQDVANKEFWGESVTICKVVPDDDILPARAKYNTQNTTNIGINYQKSLDGTAIWITLHDLIGSKFLSGKTPQILESITFAPEGIQENLKEIEIFEGIIVKPDEDFIQKIIEKRLEIKNNIISLDDSISKLIQNHLKIVANSSSYGIFIQQDIEHPDKNNDVSVYGSDESFETSVERIEKNGTFFNPVMGVFLTSGARLILATAESLVLENNGYMAYCDTDAVFISPKHVQLIQDFFKLLNPYKHDVEMFKIEDYEDENKEKHLADNVWFYGISAKRYVLYGFEDGEIVIYKYSSHGLGHLEGVDHEQWWKDILEVHYHPERKDEIISKYKNRPAISTLRVSTFPIYERFSKLNKGKSYSDSIKPFNFFNMGTATQKDPQTGEPIIPMIPKVDSSKHSQVPYMEFLDHKTGKIYPHEGSLDSKEYWKMLDHVFEDYINHPEAKSNGDIGVLERKHIEIDKNSIKYIGKEANNIEFSMVRGVFAEDNSEYVNEQKKLREIIASLTLENALEIGLDRREFYRLKKKLESDKMIVLRMKILEKLFKKDFSKN
ncbi:hypothetical protein [Nitrosopumilus sp.]|uniref:hypothetical protein n=1 Tax=Nitrosopumilus sp. TaxID=2024843 RepID=UPI00247B3773|nr:hypothetical protein [Nitrosopumilus sp.]MCV0411168.1 hypothetical protein [Nitrosopumilus sp.]